jgi:hypothetical protein
MQLRRSKIEGLRQRTHPLSVSGNCPSDAVSPVKFAPAASGRSAAGKYDAHSLVHALMGGGRGSNLPSGVLSMGSEKRTIEGLLQQVCRAFLCRTSLAAQ